LKIGNNSIINMKTKVIWMFKLQFLIVNVRTTSAFYYQFFNALFTSDIRVFAIFVKLMTRNWHVTACGSRLDKVPLEVWSHEEYDIFLTNVALIRRNDSFSILCVIMRNIWALNRTAKL
jgi:hypothetical protein